MLRNRRAELVLLLYVTAAFGTDDAARYWPQWRGPLSTGVAPLADPPVEWSEKSNIRWKIDIPGKGHSTPIVWGERVFLTTAIPYGEPQPPPVGMRPGSHDNLAAVRGQECVVMALDRRSGKILWQKTVHKDVPHEGGHQTGSFASHSPVTDGENVYAYFGSAGLYCLDVNGELKWSKDFGLMRTLHGHGEGNSPALGGDTLLINWDQEGPCFLAALDKHTGTERWRAERDEVTSWSSPIVVEFGGKKQVVVSATHRIRGYDLESGVVLWECGGMATNVVASPVSADGMVYAGSSYEKRALLAIRLDGAKGDITGTPQVAWSRYHDTPYVPSPLLYEDKLYYLKHYQGILTCITAKSGKIVYGPARIPGIANAYSSLGAAAGRIYIVSREGTTVVLKHGAEVQVLATNPLDDTFSASPAFAGNELFLRGEAHLYCIAKD